MALFYMFGRRDNGVDLDRVDIQTGNKARQAKFISDMPEDIDFAGLGDLEDIKLEFSKELEKIEQSLR